MIGLENRELHSADLVLRLVQEQDRQALWDILKDAEVTKPTGFLPLNAAEDFDAFFAGLKADHAGITILLGNTVIGYARVYREELEQPEFAGKTGVGLGFVIGKPYQNRGYGTQMLQTLTAYLKTRFDYCAADHFAENTASRRVIEKCGYRFLEEYSMVFEHLAQEEKQLRSYVI